MAEKIDGVEFSVEVSTLNAKSNLKKLSDASDDLGMSFDNIDKKSRKAQDGINRTATASGNAAAGLGNFSRQAGQAGIQVHN